MIRMNDFLAEPRELREATLRAMESVVDSGVYVLGPEVARFEQRWARLCGVAHAIGVGNGTDAIEIALRACGVESGDEVITSAMTAPGTIAGILGAGARPVLADIDSGTGLQSLASASRCVSSATRAIVLVHLYGRMAPMADWLSFCKSTGLILIEDCAQAHLARSNGQAAGSFGTAAAFSFYPTKNLGARGDAGGVVTSDESVRQQALALRNTGQRDRYTCSMAGANSRLDELQAAVLSARLPWLASFTERRRDIAAAYRSGIVNPQVQLLDPPSDPLSHVYHLFVVRCERRDRLQAHLSSHGIESSPHYPTAAHQQPAWRALRCDPVGLPDSEKHAATCLSLPVHPQLEASEIARVIEAVNAFRG